MRGRPAAVPEQGFLLRCELAEAAAAATVYPFTIPAVRALRSLELHPKVTYFVGENGSGKSTIMEAIAVAAGLNAEGGTQNFRFATRGSESSLGDVLRLVRCGRRPRTSFFLRAESYFNVATRIEEMDREPAMAPPIIDSYGAKSLHEQSHGESFLALMVHRFSPNGLYLLDEPEAALSPTRQMAALARIHELATSGCQFIIATHAPIMLAYPHSIIYELSDQGINAVEYEHTAAYTVTRDFILRRPAVVRQLLDDVPDEEM